jgi:transposase
LIEGNVSGVLFENFLFHTINHLRSLPKNRGKEIVVFMDNARIHKHPLVIESLKLSKVHVLFNSQYSPWLNPIEQFFSLIKKRLRSSNVRRR